MNRAGAGVSFAELPEAGSAGSARPKPSFRMITVIKFFAPSPSHGQGSCSNRVAITSQGFGCRTELSCGAEGASAFRLSEASHEWIYCTRGLPGMLASHQF